MPLEVKARAVTQGELLDLGGGEHGGPYVGNHGEVLLTFEDGITTHTYLLTGDGARTIGKALITEGWEALKRKMGARAALRHGIFGGTDA